MLYFYTKNNKRYKILSRTKEHGNLYVGQARKMHIKDWFYQVGGEYKVEDLKVRFNNTYQMPLPIKITFSDAVFENDLKQNMLFYPYCERGYSEFYEGSRGDLFLENGLLESDTFTTADLIYKDEDDFFKYFISDVFNSLDLFLSASKNTQKGLELFLKEGKTIFVEPFTYDFLKQDVIVKGEIIASLDYTIRASLGLDKTSTFNGLVRVREFYPSLINELSLKDYLIKFILISLSHNNYTNELAIKEINDKKAQIIGEINKQIKEQNEAKQKLKKTKKPKPDEPEVVNEENPLNKVLKKDFNFLGNDGKFHFDSKTYNEAREGVRKSIVKVDIEVLKNLPEGRIGYKVTYSGEGFNGFDKDVKIGLFKNIRVLDNNSYIVYNETPKKVGTFYNYKFYQLIFEKKKFKDMGFIQHNGSYSISWPSCYDKYSPDCLYYDEKNDIVYKEQDYEFRHYLTNIKLISNKTMGGSQRRSNW